MSFENFLNCYEPFKEPKRADEKVVEKYRGLIPENLINFWKNQGMGKYGYGIIEIINPEEYREVLEKWLGKKVPNYFPIAISGFGELYYYRKISEDVEDVCVIDPHYRSINTCAWSLKGFFEEYLCEDEVLDFVFRKDLFIEAFKNVGILETGDIYMFTPALKIGGAEKLKYLKIGNAGVHLELLFGI